MSLLVTEAMKTAFHEEALVAPHGAILNLDKALKRAFELRAKVPSEVTIDRLEAQVAILKDLLDTATSNMNKARDESTKADRETLHLKTNLHAMRAEDSRAAYAVIKEWQGRAEVAEAHLKAANALLPLGWADRERLLEDLNDAFNDMTPDRVLSSDLDGHAIAIKKAIDILAKLPATEPVVV